MGSLSSYVSDEGQEEEEEKKEEEMEKIEENSDIEEKSSEGGSIDDVEICENF